MTDTKRTLTVNHRCSLDLALWPKPLEAIRTLASMPTVIVTLHGQ